MLRSAIAVVVAVGLVLAVATPASSGQRFEDAVGDAIGESPDIVAVTIDDPDDMPVLGMSIEFASEPPLSADGETWTDALLIGLLTDPETDSDGQPVNSVELADFDTDYVIGTHGVTLPDTLESGGFLVADEDLYWFVVDVAVDGPTLTWRVDRKLIGDPDVVAFQVIAGVERDDAAEEEYDIFPAEGEPLAMYVLSSPSR